MYRILNSDWKFASVVKFKYYCLYSPKKFNTFSRDMSGWNKLIVSECMKGYLVIPGDN